MKIEQLLKYLECPYCNNHNLNLSENSIYCTDCGINYSIIEDIPVLINTDKLNEQEKKQLKWFNKHYSKFSDDTYHLENWRLSMLNRIFENDFKTMVNTYLDIGCGATGYAVIEGAKRNGWVSIGTDISIEAMVRASKLAEKQGVGNKVAFIVCSAENLPFKNKTFDYVSAISMLEHIKNDTKVIDNISNILKQSGYFYICVPNTYFRMWFFLWPLYFYHDIKIGHKRHYSIEKLDNYLLKNNIFKRYKEFYNGHLIKFYQILLEKLKKIDDKKWWELEAKDINFKNNGVQLNAIYRKEA